MAQVIAPDAGRLRGIPPLICLLGDLEQMVPGPARLRGFLRQAFEQSAITLSHLLACRGGQHLRHTGIYPNLWASGWLSRNAHVVWHVHRRGSTGRVKHDADVT